LGITKPSLDFDKLPSSMFNFNGKVWPSWILALASPESAKAGHDILSPSANVRHFVKSAVIVVFYKWSLNPGGKEVNDDLLQGSVTGLAQEPVGGNGGEERGLGGIDVLNEVLLEGCDL